jgi:hypothetical protein
MEKGHDVKEKPVLVASNPNQNDQAPADFSNVKPRSSRAFRAWPLLLAHALCCIALSLVLTLVINGYNAIDTSTPRYIDGKYNLRVADITTIISAALVVIKLVMTAWIAIAVWRCAYALTHDTKHGLSREQLLFMTKYKTLPWARWPFAIPKGPRSWAIAIILVFIFPQTLIPPLLSGAVDWNPATVPSGVTIHVDSSAPSATLQYWYQYVLSTYYTERSSIFKNAVGFASLAWSDTTTISENGTSLTGNGCRHIVNDSGLPPNSTLTNAPMPCIQIHSISWATSSDEIPAGAKQQVAQTPSLSILNDDLFLYTTVGQAVLFDPNLPWDTAQSSGLPSATLFNGTKVLALNVATQSGCTNLVPNAFGKVGNVSAFPQYMYDWALDTCYIFANVTLTAGVTVSPASTYLNSRVVEDQTPIDEVVFKADPWVENALWLLPDIMTMAVLTNSSLIPTWNNLDLYAESLIRQSYLAAWEGLHASFDTSNTVMTATPSESRIQATVSYARVFGWLGVCLLMTAGGILLLLLPLGDTEPEMPSDLHNAQTKMAKKSAKEIMKDLNGLDLF